MLGSKRSIGIGFGVGAVVLAVVVATHSVSPSPSAPGGPASGATGRTPSVTARPTALARNWSRYVAQENAKTGSAGLQISSAQGGRAGLDAFVNHVSILPGQPVSLYVTSRWSSVRVRAIRIGYYRGAGLREVWHGSMRGRVQPGARTFTGRLAGVGAIGTQMTYAPWTSPMSIATTGWPEGQYVIRVDAAGASRWVMLTVRSASAVGRVVLVSSQMTWNAYNTWGGRGLYGDVGRDFSRRSYAVSLDRPNADGFGAGRAFSYDYPILREAEKLGLPVAWLSDYDIARNPRILNGATAIVFGGHAEYWTGPMRDAVVAQAAAGANLAIFGANTAYWRVRLAGQTSSGEPRAIFGAKSASLDPLARRDPGGATARFKDAPGARREEDLTGARYDCYPASGDWVVSDPGWWGYAGTGLRRGSRITGLVGPESDRVYGGHAKPTTQVVAYSRLSCRGSATVHTGIYWTNQARAGIFEAGTMNWPRKLNSTASYGVMATMTDTILVAFSHPRAGIAHPARANYTSFWLPSVSTAHAS
jgi:hypothetical protein